jgi:hypothetical protein
MGVEADEEAGERWSAPRSGDDGEDDAEVEKDECVGA